jgi:RNA polymerase sigma-70 factor, ECF subfamily
VRVDTSRQGELEHLYRDQRDRMWRAVLAFTGDPDVASDAVAEAFAQALRRGDAIRSPERWLWRSVFRIAAGELKQRRHRGVDYLEGTYEMDESARDLIAALAELPEKQRAAVVPVIGSTAPGVHVLVSRGRKRLRELLEADDA